MEQVEYALKKAIVALSHNLDESSFENDQEYWWSEGRADGLSNALHLVQELAKGTDIDTALRMVLDIEEE